MKKRCLRDIVKPSAAATSAISSTPDATGSVSVLDLAPPLVPDLNQAATSAVTAATTRRT